MTSLRSGRVAASSSACFSGGAKGQPMASEVMRCSLGALSMASQSPSMPVAVK